MKIVWSRQAARIATVAAGSILCVVAATVLGTKDVNPSAMADVGNGKCAVTAAETLGWGAPNRSEDFSDPAALEGWAVYDSPGHGGNGRRTPSAITVADDAATITGDANGDSGGMAWGGGGQMHGRWEACVKSTPAAENYHSVLLLWPDAEDWPIGGEVDFMEITDPTRQSAEGFLHHGPQDEQKSGAVNIDATQWHSWAVEWTPQHVAYYVDGVMWWEYTNVAHLPPRPMHLCIQLDNFGGDVSQGGQMTVDWARQYAL